MRSRLRLAKHPVHPMVVMFPMALLPLLLALDGLQAYLGDEGFWRVGFWVALLGGLATLAGIATGIPDLAGIPDGTRAHRKAAFHFVVGLTILATYAAAAWARMGSPADRFGLAVGLDVAGLLLVTVQGWLGGELVYKHHMGVSGADEGGDPTPIMRKASAEDPAASGDAPRRGALRP